MLLDCGLMFPEADMPGIDLVLPDFTYLRENAHRIDGCVATHGHEDHVGGLSFLLRDVSFPIYGSPLTLGLARSRIEEAGLLGRTELIPVADGERRKVGPFDLEFIPVTHSVPYAFATAFHTPQGVDPALGRLQARPDAGRRAAHRPLTHRGDRLVRPGCACCCPTRRTPRRPATRRPSARSAGCSRTSSASTTAGGSSRHRSRATSTASSRSPTRPSPRDASWRRSGCR